MYQVDAFADRVFEGNPAAVMVLDKELDDDLMQSIAIENNLSETAYTVPNQDGTYNLRWFTPGGEVDLCGHATLATAHVIFSAYEVDRDKLTFHTRSGALEVEKSEGGYWMDFPTDVVKEVQKPELKKLLGRDDVTIFEGRDDYLIELPTEKDVASLAIDTSALAQVCHRGLIVTSRGDEYDFVSRCYYPLLGIDEDPVTGSAHTTLTPYWTVRLRKNVMDARQISARGGNVRCVFKGNRTSLRGNAVTYMKATISV